MQSIHLCVLIYIWAKGETVLRHPVKYFANRSKAVIFDDALFYFCLVFVMLSCASVY